MGRAPCHGASCTEPRSTPHRASINPAPSFDQPRTEGVSDCSLVRHGVSSSAFPPRRSPFATTLRRLFPVRRFLASPVNEHRTSRSQASPPSRRDSVRPLLSSIGGARPHQHHVRNHRMEEPAVRATHRSTTRCSDASTILARVALVRAWTSFGCSLVSRCCHLGSRLARPIVESPPVFGISAPHPICRRHLPTSPHAIPMNSNATGIA